MIIFPASISSKFEGNLGVLQSVLGSLKAYGQRISFASSRIEVLQGKDNIDNGFNMGACSSHQFKHVEWSEFARWKNLHCSLCAQVLLIIPSHKQKGDFTEQF